MGGKNRIVVNYKNREELVLLACIDPITKEETNISEIDWPHKAKKYNFDSFDEILRVNKDNFEGFVIKFNSGMRIKVKLEEYVRLHRLMTGLTKRTIWELLKDGEDVEEIYKTAPDEVYDWVEETASFLQRAYYGIEQMSEMVFDKIKENVSNDSGEFTRKDFALFVKDTSLTNLTLFVNEPYSFKVDITPIMFRILDDKDFSDLLWKKIKPEHEPIEATINEDDESK